MLTAIAVLLAGAAAVGFLPVTGHAAAMFLDRGGYLAQALSTGIAEPTAAPEVGWTTAGVLLGLLSTVAVLAVAAVQLRAGLAEPAVLRRLHSGHVGDYVAWLFAGVAALAALIGLPLL